MKSFQQTLLYALIICFLCMFMGGCIKRIPLEMVPFGGLDGEDYRIIEKVCENAGTYSTGDEKKQIPYIAYYIKIPDPVFKIDEFSNASIIKELSSNIRRDMGSIPLNSQPETIEWLNELLAVPDLYDRVSEKSVRMWSDNVRQYVENTKSYRKTKKFIKDEPAIESLMHLPKFEDSFNDYEKNSIQILNRLVLEDLYPEQTPTRPFKGMTRDFGNMVVAVPDFRTLDDAVSIQNIAKSCDDIARYLQEWKIFKKVERSVTAETELIIEGAIVRYKSILGSERATQYLVGGVFGTGPRLAHSFAYCFVEIKFIDARNKETIGAMQLNYAYPVAHFLTRGYPELFLVDPLYYAFERLVKNKSRVCLGLHPDISTGCQFDSSCNRLFDINVWKKGN